MRTLTSLVVLALAASCVTPEPVRTPAPSPATRTAPPGPVLTKLLVPAKFGEQGIRVSPNGEMVLVVEREGFVQTIYDLAGHAVATVRFGEIGMNPFWLPDSSGVLIGRRIQKEPGGPSTVDISVLEAGGALRDVATGVVFPRAEAVDFGYTDVPVATLGPDRVISSFAALPQAIADLGSPKNVVDDQAFIGHKG